MMNPCCEELQAALDRAEEEALYQTNRAIEQARENTTLREARDALGSALVKLWNHGAEASALDVLDKYVPGWRDK